MTRTAEQAHAADHQPDQFTREHAQLLAILDNNPQYLEILELHRQVCSNSSTSKKESRLQTHLETWLREALLVSTPTAYVLNPQDRTLYGADWLGNKPITQLLEEAEATLRQVGSGSGSEGDKQRRFGLENLQFLRLIQFTKEALSDGSFSSNLALLDWLADQTETHIKQVVSKIKHFLTAQGWQSQQKLSPEQASQLGVSPGTTILVGPHTTYLMPQSPHHPGNLSVYMTAYVAFVPETAQFVLLQYPLMKQRTWRQHLQLLVTAGVEEAVEMLHKLHQAEVDDSQIEQFVMEQQLKLTEDEVYQQVYGWGWRWRQRRHCQRRTQLSNRPYSEAAQLLLRLAEQEFASGLPDQAGIERLTLAIEMVKKSLHYNQPIHTKQLVNTYQTYKQQGRNGLAQGWLGVAPVLTRSLSIGSFAECGIGGVINGLSPAQAAGQLGQAGLPHSLWGQLQEKVCELKCPRCGGISIAPQVACPFCAWQPGMARNDVQQNPINTKPLLSRNQSAGTTREGSTSGSVGIGEAVCGILCRKAISKAA